MKLETVRDIYKRTKSPTGYISLGDLRAEAIKWVKNYRQFKRDVKDFEEEDNFYREDSVVVWIKHFFNLTEEDLK